MADWYVSSAAYAAIPVWAATTAYTVGQFVRPIAPTESQRYTFRCTTAGTSGASEPTWPAGNNATVANGGAVFTNVSGQSVYGWSAAGGNLYSIGNSRTVPADRVFLSSDHSETMTVLGFWAFNGGNAAFGLIQIVSVNRAGSVPPVAADIQNGAALATSAGAVQLDAACELFWQGVTFTSISSFNLNNSQVKAQYFKNCAFVFNNAAPSSKIGAYNGGRMTFDNTSVQFGHIGQTVAPIASGPFELLWINTSAPIVGAIKPTNLFLAAGQSPLLLTCRGVDFSSYTAGTLVAAQASNGMIKALFDSCRVTPGAARFYTFNVNHQAHDEAEYINCFDGTNVINERYTAAGAVTTDRSTYRSGGVEDDNGAYSLKLVSSSRSDKSVLTLDAFWFDRSETIAAGPVPLAVEIAAASALNNDDISLMVEYMGTAGSSVGSFANSLPSSLSAPTSLPLSTTATWVNPPGVKQQLQASVNVARHGPMRALVRLGKPSTTVWVDPTIRIAQ